MPPTISLCMIARNEEHNLPRCIGSVSKYVNEIVIVDTGSTDKTVELAQSLGARVLHFTPETDPNGFLLDAVETFQKLQQSLEQRGLPPEASRCVYEPFSQDWLLADYAGARNRGWSAATGDFLLWLDADDEMINAERLPEIVAAMQERGLTTAFVRYDYTFDGSGKVTTQLWRERILKRGAGAAWVNDIHEVLIPIDFGHMVNVEGMYVRHGRDTHPPEGGKQHRNHVAHRNLKILLKVLEREYREQKPDARTLFYLGNESRWVDPTKAVWAYDNYCAKSGWDEERAIGRRSLAEVFERSGDYHRALKEYATATLDNPNNPDNWFGVARVYYHQEQWQRCVDYTQRGFTVGNPDSVIMFNPLDRSYRPHLYLNVALNRLGRVEEALQSCLAGLAAMPNDAHLLFNKKLYEDFLGKRHAPEEGDLHDSIDEPLEKAPQNLPTVTLELFATQLYKRLLAHDEVLKARDLLKCLPWEIEDGSRAEELRARLAKVLPADEGALRDWYLAKATEPGPPFPSDPETWADGPWHASIPRWRFTMQHLPVSTRPLRVLEVGCQDGWLANRIAQLGHEVVGVDFSTGPLEIAKRNAAGHNLSASFYEMSVEELAKYSSRAFGGTFDVVICNEVLEHVLDPAKLMATLADKVKQGGRLIMTTPHGSWLRGKQFDWAPRWDAPRDHLSSFTARSLIELASAEGLTVMECFPAPMPRPDVPGQGMLSMVATLSDAAPAEDPLDIVIYTGPGVEWWSPRNIETTGIGGSETAVVRMAQEFQARGHRVRCYIDCPEMEGIYGGVEYLHWGRVTGVKCDVFVASRQPAVMDAGVPGKVNYLWVHDVHCGPADPKMHERMLKFDWFLCLSEWHKSFFLNHYPFIPAERVIVTANGIMPDVLPGKDEPCEKVGNRLIYSSAPDRGLEVLLDLFPRVRELVDDAELHVYYGFETLEAFARLSNNQGMIDWAARLKDRLAKTPGVTWHGRVPQRELVKAQRQAKIWAYPTAFTETYCITALEVQAARCVPVTTRLAALAENVRCGSMLDGLNTDPAYHREWVANVAWLLRDTQSRELEADKGQAFARTRTWSAVATDWEERFRKALHLGIDIQPYCSRAA